MIVSKTNMKKIPESCDKCHFYSDFLVYCSAANIPNPYNEKGERPDWCPLTEIGKCKDCIHYEFGVCLKIYDDGNVSGDSWQKRKPDDFCSYFEPKTSDKNER